MRLRQLNSIFLFTKDIPNHFIDIGFSNISKLTKNTFENINDRLRYIQFVLTLNYLQGLGKSGWYNICTADNFFSLLRLSDITFYDFFISSFMGFTLLLDYSARFTVRFVNCLLRYKNMKTGPRALRSNSSL